MHKQCAGEEKELISNTFTCPETEMNVSCMKKTALPLIICSIVCCLLYACTAVLTDYISLINRLFDSSSIVLLQMGAYFALPFFLYPAEKAFAQGEKGRGALFFWLAFSGCAAGVFIYLLWIGFMRIDTSSMTNPSEVRAVGATRLFTFFLMCLGIIWLLIYRGIRAVINWFKMDY